MALVAFASNRSPGMSTAVLAIAATWPQPRRAVVAELDPDGGTIAGRQVVAHDPGLISLAAAGSHGVTAELVAASIQQLGNETLVLLAPPGPDRVAASLGALRAGGLGRVLAAMPGLDVLADCGRIDSRSPALPYVQDADAVVLVVRSGIEDVVGLQHRLQTLTLDRARLTVVVVGRRPYGPEEVSTALGLNVLGVVDHDPRAAQALGEGGRPERSRLWRSAAAVSDALVGSIPAAAATSAWSTPSPPAPSAIPPGHGEAVGRAIGYEVQP